jgi:SNF2 family DNA or RNA helicase
LLKKDISSENQAHGRIYRIGQMKPTFFVTTIIEDTMDEGVVECEF